jgi:FixJ family two-component response regulator
MVLGKPRGLVWALYPAVGEIGVPKRPLIAIVDDDASMRDTTKDLLESAGFSAATFARAASLLTYKRLDQVACLIADMRMPEMTGLELHQQLVASLRAIPTVLMTAYPNERVRAQALKARVVGYLAKPFAAEELLTLVRLAVHGRGNGPK